MAKKVSPQSSAQPWSDHEILDPEDADIDKAKYGLRTGEIVVELGCILEDVPKGGMAKLTLPNERVMRNVQSQVRRAAELAGWCDEIPAEKWPDFITFRTRSQETRSGQFQLRIWRLRTPYMSRSVKRT